MPRSIKHERVHAALEEIEPGLLGNRLIAKQRSCEVSLFHSPTPILVDRYPLPDGTEIVMCRACADSVNTLLLLLRGALIEGQLDWALQLEFGNQVRAAARRFSSAGLQSAVSV